MAETGVRYTDFDERLNNTQSKHLHIYIRSDHLGPIGIDHNGNYHHWHHWRVRGKLSWPNSVWNEADNLCRQYHIWNNRLWPRSRGVMTQDSLVTFINHRHWDKQSIFGADGYLEIDDYLRDVSSVFDDIRFENLWQYEHLEQFTRFIGRIREKINSRRADRLRNRGHAIGYSISNGII